MATSGSNGTTRGNGDPGGKGGSWGAVRMPSVFLSHGSPMLALADDEFTHALRGFVGGFPRPRAIVALSAHWLSQDGTVRVDAAAHPRVIHDFGGFPRELYELDYPCPGDPELAARVAALLTEQGLQAQLEARGKLDHGVWIPLRLAYPEPTIPLVQVSVPFPVDPREVLKLGRALAPLRAEGVLILGSGGAVHNLERLVWHEKNSEGAPWAREFESWLKGRIAARDIEGLLNFESEAPHAALAHPVAEHFFPIFVTLGAAWPGDRAQLIYEGVQYHSLSMFSFALVGV
ncbi:MAG: dioxygenase [Oligoflexia bacterium]|nr:dioxygenase [Oligoflexia bacterium]